MLLDNQVEEIHVQEQVVLLLDNQVEEVHVQEQIMVLLDNQFEGVCTAHGVACQTG